MTDFTEAQTAAIAKVEKLMALAAGNANENEAASAADMASAILAKFNLSMDALTGSGGKEGRGKDALLGGFYQHERDLWAAISRLNYCVYKTVKVTYDAEKARIEKRKYAHHHSLIGRKVNIIGSKIMAEYLLQTMERLTKEYCLERTGKFMPRDSVAVSFRKGATERLIEKINAKRRQLLREEEAKEAAAKAAAPQGGHANALVITGLIKSEAEANYDFVNGEGAYARSQSNLARWEAQWEAERAAEAAKRLADPKYRAAQERLEAAAQAKQERRWERQSNRAAPKFNGDVRAFGAGYERASDIGLDSQIDKETRKALA